MSYLRFNKITEKLTKIWSIDPDEEIGYIEKIRVGAWMSHCLFLHPDCYLSASCLDEVREKIRELNSKR